MGIRAKLFGEVEGRQLLAWLDAGSCLARCQTLGEQRRICGSLNLLFSNIWVTSRRDTISSLQLKLEKGGKGKKVKG